MPDPVRRRLLLAAGLMPLIPAARAAGRRVVVVGGGWGGLAAAAELCRLAPGLDVLLIDREPAFLSFAGSNRWLVDHGAAPVPRATDYATLAARRGYRFVQAEVVGIDRAARRVLTAGGEFPYDWLVLAPGIREDWSAWQVDDPVAVDRLRTRFSGAFARAADLAGLKRRLQAFAGGNLVMTLPPMPYRCPPAPYERALLIAWWLKTRKIPGRLVVVDPNPLMPAFRGALLDRFRDQVTYLDHARVRAVDPERRVLSTDVDDIDFAEALLCPPQRAGGPLAAAGLLRPGPDGGPGEGWAAQGSLDFRSAADPAVFVIGDAAGIVSPQFGHYPKTGHVAARMGELVARQIAGQAVDGLPDSVCHLLSGVEPDETTRIEVGYRLRADGFLLQTVNQRRAPYAGEDAAWAAAHYAAFL